ncbi:hypothetical protein [Caballeronia sp. INDeC2]|uniref:hypothetical protein n=1 Tax=Caballeronia sp. INDeC2 TaxID=2921747 RepID=UPI0020289993|nr:hypothetical protein [Caballeronia sp. INDeC2]
MNAVRTEHEHRLGRRARALRFGERLRDERLEFIAAKPDEHGQRDEFQIEIERVHFLAPEVG